MLRYASIYLGLLDQRNLLCTLCTALVARGWRISVSETVDITCREPLSSIALR
jgi:hypothetical protein